MKKTILGEVMTDNFDTHFENAVKHEFSLYKQKGSKPADKEILRLYLRRHIQLLINSKLDKIVKKLIP